MRKQTSAVSELSHLLAVLSRHFKRVYFSVIVHISAIFITEDCELREIKITNNLIYGAAASARSRLLNLWGGFTGISPFQYETG
jgi:hypothetical protein